jgi:hypothetical protein
MSPMLNRAERDLGRAIGIIFQQARKYENGVDRIGSGRLKSTPSRLVRSSTNGGGHS